MIKRLQHISPKMIVFADQAIVSGSSFVTNILVARSLGICNYGKFSVIVMVQLFLLSIQQAASSGVYQVSFRCVENKFQHSYTSGLFHIQFVLYAVLSLICCFCFFVFPSMVNGYENIRLPAFLGTLLFLMQDFLRKILLTQKEEAKALIIDAVTNILQIALLALCVLTDSLSLSITCWIVALTFIPSVVVGLIWISPQRFSFADVQLTFAIHKKQSHWMLMSAIVQWFAGNFIVVAGGAMLGVAALGALRLSQYIFGLLNVLIQAIENYALPRAAIVKKSSIRFNWFLRNLFKKTFLMFAPILFSLSIFAKQILTLSGGTTYAEYSYAIYGLVLVYILILTGMPIRIALRAKQLNRDYLTGYVLASTFSLLTAKWLIERWHLTGVLTGLFLTQSIIVIYWSFTLYRKKILTWKLFTSY